MESLNIYIYINLYTPIGVVESNKYSPRSFLHSELQFLA